MAEQGHDDVRAGIVVTGTELLSGVTDRNGPWLSERMLEQGIRLVGVLVVGDDVDRVRSGLAYLAAQGAHLIVTTGGLGPTADDVTAQAVADFAGAPLRPDPKLAELIGEAALREGGRNHAATLEGVVKQARVPDGATVIAPVGTAPGLIVTGDGRPAVLSLPGPPPEARELWEAALATRPMLRLLAQTQRFERRVMRLLGSESELAHSLREIAKSVALDRLEITTCWRGGELEIATVFSPGDEHVYAGLQAGLGAHHGKDVFSLGGATVDELVAHALADRTVAFAEGATGGRMAARLTGHVGARWGGIAISTREALTTLARVSDDLIEEHGLSSPVVASVMAANARESYGADVGIGITPVTAEGTVAVAVVTRDGHGMERSVALTDADDITNAAMHLLREVLHQERASSAR
jgi:nicotinamide-nucleotide amidase